MDFVPLAEFLPRVRLIAKGVPDDVALDYIGQAAFEFAVKTRLLKRELVFDVQADVQDYYLEAGECEQVHLIRKIDLDCDVCGTASCAVDAGYCANQNLLFDFEPPEKIWLKKRPDADAENAFRVEYVAAPTQTACEVDRLLFDRYQDAVVSGALAYLLLMRQYDFAAPQLADRYESRFRREINRAKIEVAREVKTNDRHFIVWGKV
ncbi:hypothetical protein D0T90_10135 [Neisseria animalis]|uniref:Uncharacterized protein n=1 Tax=Neisseria animalis TaxID=492 RepID=A0A5P3MTJ1_NEIAN|nr:hypothetical protein D0T90_10135 [Neisseria animalis]ROW31819.1 hypothetical protein CGZ60_08030 [Neisseria animalis]